MRNCRPSDWMGEVAKPSIVPTDINGFDRGLRQRSNLMYIAVQYSVVVWLRYRQWFLTWLAKREFLRVGNSESKFDFGALRKEERLQLLLSRRPTRDR